MSCDERQVLPSLSELLDRLAINQIKTLLLPGNISSYDDESNKIQRDVDLLVDSNRVRPGIDLVRLVIALAQINLHIWQEKNAMDKRTKTFPEHLKLSHQLNGLRNQIKNQIAELENSSESRMTRSNIGTDGLEGWDMSVLRRHEDAR